jgi:hypothetical protein
MFILCVIEVVFLLPREGKLFSARRNFWRLVWEKISTLFFDTAKVQQFFRMSKYFAKYFLIISQIFFCVQLFSIQLFSFYFGWKKSYYYIILYIYNII